MRPVPRPTAEILEVKSRLVGPDETFECHAIAIEPAFAVLLYVSTEPRAVAGLTLPAGTATLGTFWCDRPYNVYHWLRPSGETIGYYFNVADRTQIDERRLSWRDLIVDVLVLPPADVRVLDEDELPPDLSASLRDHIESAKAAILTSWRTIVAEIEARSRTLWPRVADPEN